MTTLFDATRRVNIPSRSFGRGLLAAVPYAGRMPYTVTDLAWAAAAFGEHAADFDVIPPDDELDHRAAEAEALDRLERGCLL